MSRPLQYLGYSVTFQEVPDEVSLVINISGCQHNCKGCHSEYLREHKGEILKDDFHSLIAKYDGLITCVCFMGGDHNLRDLEYCNAIAKSKKLKTCVYFGVDNPEILNELSEFDYVKIGSYQEDKGGLDNPNTNQKFYKNIGYDFINITHKFQKVVS